jgi:hypothetical protein
MSRRRLLRQSATCADLAAAGIAGLGPPLLQFGDPENRG